jgi:D-sedoheptulose 7-phosphate isomerase
MRAVRAKATLARARRAAFERGAARTLRAAARSAAQVDRANRAALAGVVEAVVTCLRAGGTVFTCGNGGSAADAQHLSCELAGRYLYDRPALACVALTTNTSALTAIANDYSYDHVFSRQLEGSGRPGDVLVAFSTSGRSRSVLRAVAPARRRGLTTVAFTGRAGRAFARRCHHALISPARETPRVQEGHLMLMHALCELVERELFPRGRAR